MNCECMKKLDSFLLAAVIIVTSLMAAPSAFGQDAVQWKIEDDGNGHWYQLISIKNGDINTLQNQVANTGASLVSIQDEHEQAFVAAMSAGLESWTMIGAKIISSQECGATSWKWFDGTPWRYLAWDVKASQPDCNGIATEFIGTWGVDQAAPPRTAGMWHDVQVNDPQIEHAVIEWSNDCNGDGIVDYGQILNGELLDENGNNTPDCCEDATCLPPVQWRIDGGGNGHWYVAVGLDETVCWEDASTFAFEQGGHLATPVTAEEDLVLQFLLKDVEYGIGAYIGGFQNLDSPDYSEPDGGWEWISGEPWSYTNWHLDEPANRYGGEHYLAADWTGLEYGWFDMGGPDAPQGPCNKSVLVIEYSNDCNGDGIVDYGQILSGELLDDDGNNIPDCCEDATCLPPVQWPVEDDGNGHWYQLISIENGDINTLQNQVANTGASLVSIQDEHEQAFVAAMSAGLESWTMIGAKIISSQECGATSWKWFDGTPWRYLAWDVKASQPDCNGIATEFIGTWGVDQAAPPRTAGMWHDVQVNDPQIEHAVIEWSNDCNGDGIVDYGQIISGELADVDGDNILDSCEQEIGDLDLSGMIDGADIALLLAYWGNPNAPVGDLNGDGTVNGVDLAILLANWGVIVW